MRKDLPNLCLTDGVLHRRCSDRFQLVLPTVYQKRALEGCHVIIKLDTWDKSAPLSCWKREILLAWDVHVCQRSCQKMFPLSEKENASQPESSPCQYHYVTTHGDGLHGLSDHRPSKGGIENVFIDTDHFSKYAQAYPTENPTARTTAKILSTTLLCAMVFLLDCIVTKGGMLRAILSSIFVKWLAPKCPRQLHTMKFGMDSVSVSTELSCTCLVP